MSKDLVPEDYLSEFFHEKPLDLPKFREWIKEHQWNFLNALTDYGDLVGTGRKFFWQLGSFRSPNPHFQINQVRELDVFTGSGFCALTCAIMFQAIKQHFGPEIGLKIMSRSSNVPNIYSVTDTPKDHEKIANFKIIHAHLHFLGADGKIYFIDPTYGQINKRVNRVVTDLESKEDDYYGEATSDDQPEEEITNRCLDFFDIPDYSYLKSSIPSQKYEEVRKVYDNIYHSLGLTPPEDKSPVISLNQQKTRGEAA
ncbi:MAG: hypothetical protein Q7S44_01625 [bacterium]|nr:hypothetical protein [bacterium]